MSTLSDLNGGEMTVTITGRTGADQSFKLVAHLCRLFVRYEAKLRALVATLQSNGTITALDATAVYNWIDATKLACAILDVIAGNSNVNA